MRFFGKFALATAMATATVGAATVPTAVAAQEGGKPSKEYVALYNALADQINAGNVDQAVATYNQMLQVSGNDRERYLASKLGLQIAMRTNPVDTAMKTQAATTLMNSQLATPEERGSAALELTLLAYNDKNYQQAIDYAAQAKQLGYTDPQVDLVAGLSRIALNQPEGYDQLRTAIGNMEQTGQEVPEQWYALAANNALKSKNSEEQIYWTREQLKAYPTDQNWRSALVSYLYGAPELTKNAMTDLFRLRTRAGAMSDVVDYEDYVDSVSLSGQIIQPSEALAILDKGIQSGAITGSETFVKEALVQAREGKQADTQGYEARERAAVSGNDARRLSSAADVAFDQGRYDRAVELYELAGNAGADADVVAIRKGIANYELGNMAQARANFDAVSKSPYSDIAGYWLLYLDQNQQGAAAN